MESFQHQLQKFDPGIIWLDGSNSVMAMNSVAMKVLGADPSAVLGTELLKLHPEKSREKVAWLLDSSRCPAEAPPPQTMMINTPDRVLLIKVSKMCGEGDCQGTCMVFYDLTETVTGPRSAPEDEGRPRLLYKVPVYQKDRVVLVDLSNVVYLKAEGHYTAISTEKQNYLCNLSLAALEERLDPSLFVRTHRSYMINIRYALAFEKASDSCAICMQTPDEDRIPVSRNNVAMIKQMLGLV